jgi:NADH-quinone oxidoreductase subunit L
VADPGLPCRLASAQRPGSQQVLVAIEALIVQPIYRGSVRLWERFDEAVIDGMVNGVGRQVERGAGLLRMAQVGYVQVYALILTLGAVVVIGYLALR